MQRARMDIYMWFALSTVLLALPGTIVSTLELYEWLKKRKGSGAKPN
jgi:hypothetical protein